MPLAVSRAFLLVWRHMDLGVFQCIRSSTTRFTSSRPMHFLMRMSAYQTRSASPSRNITDSRYIFSCVSPGCLTEHSVCTLKIQHKPFWACLSQKRTLSKNVCQMNSRSASNIRLRKQVSCLAPFMSVVSSSCYNYINSCQNFRGMHALTGISDSGVGQSQLVIVRRKSRKTVHDGDEELEEALADDDYDAPTTFRKVTIYVKSLRVDGVVSSALDMSRNKVDELFYGSRLRLNGKTLLKKSRQLDEGDYVDLVMERSAGSEDEMLVKRVKILSVSDEKTSKDKVSVTVKVWKTAFSVKDEAKTQWQ